MLNASPHQILYRIFSPSNNASSKVQLKKPRIEYVKIPYSAILVYQLLKMLLALIIFLNSLLELHSSNQEIECLCHVLKVAKHTEAEY